MRAKNKNDLRYQKAEKKIRAAVRGILKQREIMPNVRAICRVAKIRRSTFYRHYKSLRTMLNEHYQIIWDGWRVILEENDDDMFCIFYDLLWFVRKNRLSFELVGEREILKDMLDQVRPSIMKEWSKYQAGLNDQMFVACRGALVEIIIYWVENLDSDVGVIRKYAVILKKMTDEFSRYGRLFVV